MTIVVVSPHLDDAALSLPAWLAASRERVVVLTVFSEGDASYPLRRSEDLTALAGLGVEAAHLGLLDAPERLGLARSWRALVLGELVEDDVAAVHESLARCIDRRAPTTVLLPLGVGEHVDHRVVHSLHPRVGGRVGFYEDRPYALVRHAVRARLARVGAHVEHARAELAAAEFLESARAAPHVHALLPADERESCLAPLAAMLTAPPRPTTLDLRSETFEFHDPGVLAAAGAALRAYASQLAELFGPADPIALLLGERPYVERIHWRL